MRSGLNLPSSMGKTAVAFALQNNVPVTVTFLLWRFDRGGFRWCASAC